MARNPDYWEKSRPHLDGIEYTIIPNRFTAVLAFIAGKFDRIFPFEVSIPLLEDIQTGSVPCDLRSIGRSAPGPACSVDSAGGSGKIGTVG